MRRLIAARPKAAPRQLGKYCAPDAARSVGQLELCSGGATAAPRHVLCPVGHMVSQAARAWRPWAAACARARARDYSVKGVSKEWPGGGAAPRLDNQMRSAGAKSPGAAPPRARRDAGRDAHDDSDAPAASAAGVLVQRVTQGLQGARAAALVRSLLSSHGDHRRARSTTQLTQHAKHPHTQRGMSCAAVSPRTHAGGSARRRA